MQLRHSPPWFSHASGVVPRRFEDTDENISGCKRDRYTRIDATTITRLGSRQSRILVNAMIVLRGSSVLNGINSKAGDIDAIVIGPGAITGCRHIGRPSVAKYAFIRHITLCRSTGLRRGEGRRAGADRLGRDVGQRGQLCREGGRADSGIALEDVRPMGKAARPGESPRARRVLEEPTPMIV